MKFGIVQFPGSNCDNDCLHVARSVLQQQADLVWHEETSLAGFDALVLPGGFSYGDYLRSGSIARFSPVMRAVTAFANAGGLVLGICNGFQILTEAGLLPGALLRNNSMEFHCGWVNVRVQGMESPFMATYQPGQVLRMPIAHGDGNYVVDPETLNRMRENGQILLRYCDAKGDVAQDANPNGSVDNIAGICNEAGNVFALMPHPERCAEAALGGSDGLGIWQAMVLALAAAPLRA
ncbi:MAG: phosphoribosylformylglycinamidine synthase subunit PurQ [Chloroflexi bacterium]|nr:phosphoribosylformylglycinamidine synthase subunit PurQ [Chloroflexota bacterium]